MGSSDALVSCRGGLAEAWGSVEQSSAGTASIFMEFIGVSKIGS